MNFVGPTNGNLYDLIMFTPLTTDASVGLGVAYLGIDQVSLTEMVTNVPEPATLLLLGFGLSGLFFLRRRHIAGSRQVQ